MIDETEFGISLMQIRKRSGPRNVSWVTPVATDTNINSSPGTTIF